MYAPYPLFAYGDTLNFYGVGGSANVTGQTTDPFGGNQGFILQDTDGGSFQGRTFGANLTRAGYAEFGFFVKVLGYTSDCILATVQSSGMTPNSYRAYFNNTTGAFATDAIDRGTRNPPINCGNGWWYLSFSFTDALAQSTTLTVYPAGFNTAQTATAAFFVQSVAFGFTLDNAIGYDQPRDGSEFKQAASGVESAWIVGTDNYLQADLRHIPARTRMNPTFCTGFFGESEYPGFNASVKGFIRSARAKTLFNFVPDYRTPVAVASYLVEPQTAGVDLDGTRGDYKVSLTIRNPNNLPYV